MLPLSVTAVFDTVTDPRRDTKNGLHWVLDVVFREDRSRGREGNAGANLAMIRRGAVSFLKRSPGREVG